MKHLFLFTITLIVCTGMQATETNSHSQEEHSIVQDNDTIRQDEVSTIDSVLELAKDQEIPTPEITPPSALMAWFRSVGISLLYKYHAIKSWLFGKENKNIQKAQNKEQSV